MGVVFPFYASFFVSYLSDTAQIVFTIGCVAAGIMVGAFSYIIGKITIIAYIKNLSKEIEDIAKGEGDLTKRIEIDSNNEIGELTNWLNLFIKRIHALVLGIANQAESLSDSSKDLFGSSSLLRTNAQEMTDSSNNISSTAKEISINTRSISDSTDTTSSNVLSLSSSATTITDTIGRIAQETDEAQRVSADTKVKINNSTNKIVQLESSMDQITQTIDFVSDISAKTKLLALNATIESARAGSAGKGFAVVAHEVKDLALQTEKATKQIHDIVIPMKNSTTELVTEAEDVEKSTKILNEIFVNIHSSVEEQKTNTNDLLHSIQQMVVEITNITTNLKESSITSNLIATNISLLNNLVSEVDKSSRFVEERAETMNQMGSNLAELVAKFKV